MQKRVFEHMRTAKAQISLRIRAIWSGPSVSANRIIGCNRMYQWRVNARVRLCACVEWIWISAVCACSKTPFRLARPIWKLFVLTKMIFKCRVHTKGDHHGTMRTAQTNVSLRIRTVWSGILLFCDKYYSILPNDSASGQRRRRSDCRDAQSDLRLRCPQTPQTHLFWHGLAQMIRYVNWHPIIIKKY